MRLDTGQGMQIYWQRSHYNVHTLLQADFSISNSVKSYKGARRAVICTAKSTNDPNPQRSREHPASPPVLPFSQPNKPRPLRKPILNPSCPSNSKWPPRVPHMSCVVEAPKLPRAVLSSKAVNDSLTPGMLGDEICAIVDDVVHHNPGAA